MLSDDEARTMEAWSGDATTWARASQTFVGASTELATSSRGLAAELVTNGGGSPSAERTELSQSLITLAGVVEAGAREQSEGYLGTAASLEQLLTLLD